MRRPDQASANSFWRSSQLLNAIFFWEKVKKKKGCDSDKRDGKIELTEQPSVGTRSGDVRLSQKTRLNDPIQLPNHPIPLSNYQILQILNRRRYNANRSLTIFNIAHPRKITLCPFFSGHERFLQAQYVWIEIIKGFVPRPDSF